MTLLYHIQKLVTCILYVEVVSSIRLLAAHIAHTSNDHCRTWLRCEVSPAVGLAWMLQPRTRASTADVMLAIEQASGER